MKDCPITSQEKKIELLKDLISKEKAEKSGTEGVRSMIENSSNLSHELDLRIEILDVKCRADNGAHRNCISHDMFPKITAKCNDIRKTRSDCRVRTLNLQRQSKGYSNCHPNGKTHYSNTPAGDRSANTYLKRRVPHHRMKNE